MVVSLKIDSFGLVEDHITKEKNEVKRFTWDNSATKVTVQVISYGAMIYSVKVPSKTGDIADVALGYDTIEGYLKNGNPPYINSMMGRVANRIADGEFELDGKKFTLAKNFLGKHGLHGGIIGFDKFNWNSHVVGTKVYLTHLSHDMFEGYPGNVLVTIEFSLSEEDEFSMNVTATTDKPTIVNISNHAYFNLAGHDAGYKELYKHKMTINADRILKITPEQIPTGEFQDVKDTCFDFRSEKDLGSAISQTPGNGYDYNFCTVLAESGKSLSFTARAVHPESGRMMEVFSDQPSVLFYTSNNLPDPCGNISPALANSDANCNKSSDVVGKGGAPYKKHGAFCLETQKYADAIHHKHFPSIILNPGEVYENKTTFKFSVVQG